MGLLERTISYDQLAHWGAMQMYEERHVRRWFGQRDAITVDDALDLTTEPGRVFWLVMREQLLPAEVMHRLALEECRGFLDRLAADSVYVDFRSRRALDEKERWLSGERSLGELTIARDKAARVRDDVIELGDERATTGAQAVCHALSADPSHAFRNVVYKVLAIYDTPDEVARVKDLVRRRLREHDARAAAPFTT